MNRTLYTIVVAEFLAGSLWFSANGIADALMLAWQLTPRELGYLTNAVQLGFITGTLMFAVSGLADRFPASRIFAICAIIGSLANGLFILVSNNVNEGLVFRFITGMALAGVYPIGMKLVVGWAPDKKAQALGWLVGMLTLGTALPHGLRGLGGQLQWQWTVWAASVLALIAAIVIWRLGDGPHHSVNNTLRWGGVNHAFLDKRFRAAVLGYFGHMWELYAFWTICPFIVAQVIAEESWQSPQRVSIIAFTIIGIGALGCIYGGKLSHRIGSAKVALLALAVSGCLCLIYPILIDLPSIILLIVLIVWGIAVVADSPQFSALASSYCPPLYIGSALAVMNSIGFLLSAFAIDIVTGYWQEMGTKVTWLLLPGPVIGVYFIAKLTKN